MPFSQTTVGVAAIQIAPFNKLRLGITIRSLGVAQCFISNDRVNIAAQGFPIAIGEYLTLLERDGDDPAAALYAITAAGTADLRIIESYERIIKE